MKDFYVIVGESGDPAYLGTFPSRERATRFALVLFRKQKERRMQLLFEENGLMKIARQLSKEA